MTIKHFFSVVEDYYGAPYRDSVKAAVYERVGRKSPDFLDVLYKYLRLNISNRYKQPPGEQEIVHTMREVYEAYPEFSPEAQIDRVQRPALTDDAGAIPVEVGMEYVSDLLQAFRAGEIRPDDADDDGRLTAYEYEQAWRERKGIA